MERDPSRHNNRVGGLQGLRGTVVGGIQRVITDRKIHTLLEHSPDGTSSLSRGDEQLSVRRSLNNLSLSLRHNEEGVTRQFELDAIGNRLRGFTIVYARVEEFDPARAEGDLPIRERVYVCQGTPEQNTLPFSELLQELGAANSFAATIEPNQPGP